MKLWILRPRLEGEGSLWDPWYDKSFGFVVRAETEKDARKAAAMRKGDEGAEAWLYTEYSSCDELTAEGEEGVIIKDFASA